MLYFIGLGLGDETDITIKGYNAIQQCDYIYLDHYTAILGVDVSKLEKFYNKQVILATRELVESQHDIINNALTHNIAFCCVGDCFAATTHHDLYLRAIQHNIQVQCIYNASIMNTVGVCGLQLYRYGETVSIPFNVSSNNSINNNNNHINSDSEHNNNNYNNTIIYSYYDKIYENRTRGLHTLCLLDIKVREQTPDNIAKGIKVYEPPRYMTVKQGIECLLQAYNAKKKQHKNSNTNNDNNNNDNDFKPAYDENTPSFGVCRIGHNDEFVVSGTLHELSQLDNYGGPLHSLVICGDMHDIEQQMYHHYHWNKEYVKQIKQKLHDEQHKKYINESQQQYNEAQQRLQQLQLLTQQRQQAKAKQLEEAKAKVQQRLQAQNNDDNSDNEAVEISGGLFD